jgi:hypothetical protein
MMLLCVSQNSSCLLLSLAAKYVQESCHSRDGAATRVLDLEIR